jgi:Na+-translocating ferredoxin:NAD+ oxidoreductase RNF subunit RnfB
MENKSTSLTKTFKVRDNLTISITIPCTDCYKITNDENAMKLVVNVEQKLCQLCVKKGPKHCVQYEPHKFSRPTEHLEWPRVPRHHKYTVHYISPKDKREEIGYNPIYDN